METASSSPTMEGRTLIARLSHNLDEVTTILQSNDLLRCRLDEALNKNEELEGNVSELQVRRDMQQARIDALELEMKRLKEGSAELAKEKARADAFEQVCADIEGENLKLKASSTAPAEQNARIAFLEQENKKVLGQKAMLLGELGKMVGGNIALSEENRGLASQNSILQKDSLRYQKDFVRKPLEVATKKIAMLEKHGLDDTVKTAALEKQIKSMQNELDDAVEIRCMNLGSIDESRVRIRALESDLAILLSILSTERCSHERAMEKVKDVVERSKGGTEQLLLAAGSQNELLKHERLQYIAHHRERSYDIAHLESRVYTLAHELAETRSSQATEHAVSLRQLAQVEASRQASDLETSRWKEGFALKVDTLNLTNASIHSAVESATTKLADEVRCQKADLAGRQRKIIWLGQHCHDLEGKLAVFGAAHDKLSARQVELDKGLEDAREQAGRQQEKITSLGQHCHKLEGKLAASKGAPNQSSAHQAELEKGLEDARAQAEAAATSKSECEARIAKLMKQAGARELAVTKLMRDMYEARSECDRLKVMRTQRKRYLGTWELDGTPKAELRPKIYDLYAISKAVEVTVDGRAIGRGFDGPANTVTAPRDEKPEQLEERIPVEEETENLRDVPWELTLHGCLGESLQELDLDSTSLSVSPTVPKAAAVGGSQSRLREELSLDRPSFSHDNPQSTEPGEVKESTTLPNPKVAGQRHLSLSMASEGDDRSECFSLAEATLPTPASAASPNDSKSPLAKTAASSSLAPSEVNSRHRELLPDRLATETGAPQPIDRTSLHDLAIHLQSLPKRPRQEDGDDPRLRAPKRPRSFNNPSIDSFRPSYRQSSYEHSRPSYCWSRVNKLVELHVAARNASQPQGGQPGRRSYSNSLPNSS